mmetsp:Transcript_17583/g.12536  ORF Transcript_17583/g.12536 Transcript_17583/m.12536 type:complete len:88 (+) Transcript_17583:896-1159(+)
MVFHLNLQSYKLPSLVLNCSSIALEVLICLTRNAQVYKYYEALQLMKLSTHSLEVFNKLSVIVELPKEFIQLFIRNCMSQCINSKEN